LVQPRTKIWQKWPRLIVIFIVAWPLWGQFAIPSSGEAQDEQHLDDLEGTFTVTIAGPDIPRNLSDGPALEGIWSVDFGTDGAFTVTRLDVGQVASGRYEVGATTITFSQWNGLIGCAGDDGEGDATYGWRRSESAVTLTPIREACPERITLLSTRPLGSDQACAGFPQPLSAPAVAPADETIPASTPKADVPPVSGVAVQEGLSEAAEAEMAVDALLRRANGCWATGDPQSFLALHSDAAIQQLVFTAPPDILVSQLRQTMLNPATFERIGDVNLSGTDRAWAYVQFIYDDEPLPVLVDFINEHGNWLFDTYIPSTLLSSAADVNVQP